MKPLKERLAEKAARLAKEEKKLSGPVKSYRFSLPMNGYPYMSKESDVAYVKGRAEALVKKIRNFSAAQLYDGLREAIIAEDKRRAETRRNRSWWDTRAIPPAINPYIVVRKNEDGTLTDEDTGTIYCAPTKAPETVPVATAPTEAQLAERVNELSRRIEQLQNETPRSVEHAQRLLEDAGNLEVDLQEVLRELESDSEAEENDTTAIAEQLANFDNPTSPPVVEDSLENIPTSGVALSHTVENNLTPTPLPEGLTFPMDYVYSIASGGTPAASRLRRPLARSARRRRNIIRQASESI
jgi:hypothetical protein